MKHFPKLLIVMVLLVSCQQTEKQQTTAPVPYLYWESNSVFCNGIRMHYWRTNTSGKPVMVLAHGITDFGLNWAPLAGRLEKDYDIIMYDARGHGFSAKPEGPYDLETHVQDLVAFLGVLAIEKPILIGHSMGGSVVALAAATYPDLPAAVIMEDPPMDEALEYLTPEIIPDWKAWVTEHTTMPKTQLIENARTIYHPGWSDFDYDLWAESKRLVIPNVIDIVEGAGFGNPPETFPRISAPTLILKADAEEEFRKRHLATAALLPNGRLIHIAGANHVIRNDKPDVVEQAIRDFLKGDSR